MVISRWDRQQRRLVRVQRPWRRKVFRWLLIGLAFVAILPPFYFHFKLRQFRQFLLGCCQRFSRVRELNFKLSLWSRCNYENAVGLEILLSYVLMGVTLPRPFLIHWMHIALLFVPRWIALRLMFLVLWMENYLLFMTGRELQQISGNRTSRVGHLSKKEIEELQANHHLSMGFHDLYIPTIKDALKLVSGSVQQVILDAKVGPPLYEKGLAKDIIATIERTQCKNCLVWAKSDSLARDVVKLSPDVMVGYVVMMDPSTGTRTKLLRMRDAGVVGVYHPLVDEKLVRILHGRNKKVYAWTVDDKISMQKMLIEHVDAVVTSNPGLLQRLMQETRTQCLEEGFTLSS